MTRNQECAKFLFGQVHKEATPFEKCVQAQDARGFQGRMPNAHCPALLNALTAGTVIKTDKITWILIAIASMFVKVSGHCL